jgi:Fe-S-cluster-containing hydrogenase component 2
MVNMAVDKGKKKTEHGKESKKSGWGMENYPYPAYDAYIECDEMKCTGCGICQMACSMKHFGVLNKELSRIQVRKYLLPLPKAVQVTCVQCLDEERECEKACPLSPPAIFYDKDLMHLVIDGERCLGKKCMQCSKACSANAIRIYTSVSPIPFVCDLCDTENTGDRRPECVNVCPSGALNFMERIEFPLVYTANDIMRKSADEKAELISKRLYPLRKHSLVYPGWREG